MKFVPYCAIYLMSHMKQEASGKFLASMYQIVMVSVQQVDFAARNIHTRHTLWLLSNSMLDTVSCILDKSPLISHTIFFLLIVVSEGNMETTTPWIHPRKLLATGPLHSYS